MSNNRSGAPWYPSIEGMNGTTSDGPHGVRSEKFFQQPKAACLPCGTAMGATFNKELIYRVGCLLADEVKAHKTHILLAPTVCLQRSPLIGRGFEAFGEDPIQSGSIAAQYVNGLQEQGVGACLKHYAAHDQSDMSIEDNIVMTERTLREIHTLPFQVALRECNPWLIMTAYHKVNGVHAAEDPKLIRDILRDDWGYDGVVVCDWWGIYSTSSAINAGLDLEMPGPTDWRGKNLTWAVRSRKVSMQTLDAAVARVLQLINRVIAGGAKFIDNANTPTARALIRQLTAESVVLLKNERHILPLDANKRTSYGLIGDHWKRPAVAGGGSSEVEPYYVSTPYDAFVEVVGKDSIQSELGCYSHKFAPLIDGPLTQPDTADVPGLLLEFFDKDPTLPDAKLVYTTASEKSTMSFADSLPEGALPEVYFLRARGVFRVPQDTKYRFGLSVAGRARLLIDGQEAIDQFTSHPKKTDNTPVFNGFTMERFANLEVRSGVAYNLEIHLVNEDIGPRVGNAPAGGVRLGGFEVVDEDAMMERAVALARRVDVPIVLTGLSSDYEYEGIDRKSLSLPGRIDELIQRVTEANPNAVIVTEAGTAIAMPWVDNARTLVHSWLGGQETGHGIIDILFGNVNPSGRLSLTFPRTLEDSPAFLNFGKSDADIVYGEGVFVGYRWYEKTKRAPLFYFGYGLSYTSFQYSNLVVPPAFQPDPQHVMTITVDLTNVGRRAGSEVVQVYIADFECSVQRPKKELKAFAKVYLQPGESRTVQVQLDKYAISFWCQRTRQWVAEAGEFGVVVATSASPNDEVLRRSFHLAESFAWRGV
ncbi:glycoside hydrolase superfamily [Aspergillus similis]